MSKISEYIIMAITLNLLCGIIGAAQIYAHTNNIDTSFNNIINITAGYAQPLENTSQNVLGENTIIQTPKENAQVAEVFFKLPKLIGTAFTIILSAVLGSFIFMIAAGFNNGSMAEVIIQLLMGLFLVLFNAFVALEIYQIFINKKQK